MYPYAVFFIILLVRQSSALKYLFVPENDEFFSDCSKQPDNVLNINGLFDMSNFTIMQKDGVIQMSGNSTVIWQIHPGDRIQVSFQLFRFDRIGWFQTPFSMTVFNICPILYDEPQYWYKYWTKNIINKEDVKDKCVSPGTQLIHKPFELNLVFELTGLPLNGRYKNIVTVKPFSAKNVMRKTNICIEVEGQFERLN
ncbi:uncharacterized protein LOC111605045 [Drosophila hydei]|uniref:Uncharacterized protein LOC111605045 n=1 Tax=Drosophila hydei TaxID=7224 RepID=A0A6J1MEI9_DROHY|nr:uncharacterized protein LOC111605045 [Drosophila hydei]